MTIRLQMLEAASKSKTVLEDSTELVRKFVEGKLNKDGGFSGRSKPSDLYYTVFGIQSLTALDAKFGPQNTLDYLKNFNPSELDLVNLSCLARCRADLGCTDANDDIIDHLKKFQTPDGGYSLDGTGEGTVYGAFLAVGIFQDAAVTTPYPDKILQTVNKLKTDDGGYANEQALKMAIAPVTSAALMIRKFFDQPTDESAVDYLCSRLGPEGGFYAMEGAPIPDLLSTATTLHTLNIIGVANQRITANIKECCLDYIDSLWSGKGGFCGSSADPELDCEYTFYGLLALGHLSD
jgi:prenyltransferase beta subunit